MKRIYEPSAYSAETDRYWAQTGPKSEWAKLGGDLDVDVAVVGGGFTGLNAAATLALGGARTAVLDAMSPAWGASGRNGGFCCLGGTKLSNSIIKSRFGADAAAEWFQTQAHSVAHVRGLLDQHSIDADTHSEGETQLAHSRRAWKAMQTEAEHIYTDYGVSPVLIEQGDLAVQGLAGPWFGAMTTPLGFALNPQKYHDGLARYAVRSGANLFGNAPVTDLKRENGRWTLTAQDHKVTAGQVVLATNGYSSDDLPNWLRARYLPVQSSIILTRVLSAKEQQAAGWWSSQMAYDSRHLLHYFRLLPDGRFLFGMRGGLSASKRSQARISQKIRADFQRLFPVWTNVDITHEWSGLICLMPRLMPFVGPVPGHSGLFAAMGFHGNGVAMGSFSGHLLAQHILTGHQLPTAVSKTPSRFPLGRFRRCLLAPAYTMAGLLDR
ncbi:NAD(P)/FAD-dependent oxidoreductase [Pelagimonas varians]|uniref:Gamma-glutamylputrescine oxidoreductase n=1 Tax=Pelagimonas varians TaxID=696760 RepID=A0A238KJU9_9RHOB|nr:FAD-binding oxidoreductase [Pelagimonas varians]PYG29475.1 glycine/D-amino acid oxidase-like deaminating enzyme [Pelagimonas varians]SMX42988.1 Gamma-glutamylputrescine oxidoreductase [Pelagimonas varians]